MEPEAYQAWLANGGLTGTMEARGEQLFQQLACNTCHRTDNQGRGPSLAGLFGSQVTLSTGQTITADEGYIRESILTPQMKQVEGYGPIMPTFQGLVNEDGMLSLIEYVKSLSGGTAQQASATGAVAPAGGQR